MSQYKSKLQTLYCHQKHAARIINFRDKFTHAKPLCEQTNTFTVYEMNIHQALCFMCLCKNGNASSNFQNVFKLRSNNKYKTTPADLLLKPLCKKSFTKFKLNYLGPHLWNHFIALDNNLFEVQPIEIFKKCS